MKKTFKMINLDCANCAAKMENSVNKLNGVNSCSISFLSQKMKIDIDESRESEIMSEVLKACKKVDYDCDIEM